MINGSNEVYSPVSAYGVMPFADGGIISGGSGDSNILVQGTRFFWVYNPDSPETSGFTGNGWHCGEANTPLADATEPEVLEQIQNEGNLDKYFAEWQKIVEAQVPGETDYVKDFIRKVGLDCFSTNPAS